MLNHRTGQTFSLVHLIELLLALLILAVIGVGLVSMVTGITFLQQYFAKDNAYIVESLHAVPNGGVEYGYLWNGKDYTVQFEGSRVHVGKVTNSIFGSFQKSTTVRKAYGTSTDTTILPTDAFPPQYYQFSVRGKEEREMRIVERVSLQTCPEDDSATTISLPATVETGISSQMTALVVDAVKKQTNTIDSGPSVAVVFRQEIEASVTIYDRVAQDATARLACVTARHLDSTGLRASQDSATNIPDDMKKTIDADIIILIKGDIQRQESYRTAVVEGLLEYWIPEKDIAQQVPTPTGDEVQDPAPEEEN